MKPIQTSIQSTVTALACLTAISVAGYTLYAAQQKDVDVLSSTNPKDEDEVQEQQAPSKVSETDSTAEEMNTKSDEEITSSKNMNFPSQIQVSAEITRNSALARIQTPNTITIAYASTTGTCKSFARSLSDVLTKLLRANATETAVQMCTVDELDWWDELLNNEEDEDEENAAPAAAPPIVIFILPTWTGGTLPEQYATLLTSLDEICHDWRVAPKPLRSGDPNAKKVKGAHFKDTKTIQIASFGMGSTAYDNSTFCKPAKDAFKSFMKLGARSLLTSHGKSVVGTGDDDAGDCKAVFKEWMDRVVIKMEEMHSLNLPKIMEEETKESGCCKSNSNGADSGGCGCQEEKTDANPNTGCCSNNEEEEEVMYSDVESDYDSDEYSAYESDYDLDEEKEPEVMDLEDIGNAMNKSASEKKNKVVKEMVTPKQAVALKKEGYRIIGTHSAVKLCRWTKHQLRGRGGCYKHTFYGITSYQCMEATPSLACANKCKCVQLELHLAMPVMV